MNNNVSKGKWKQMRGQATIWWAELTNDNLKKVGGKFEKFFGQLQEKVGSTQQQAGKEYKRRK